MPLPSIIITTRCKAHGLRHLHTKNIKAICASVHLGEKSTMGIPDAHYPMLDSAREPFSSSCPKLMMEFLNVGM